MSDNPNQADLGGIDFGALIQQAQAMKSKVDDAQQQVKDEMFEGSAVGGKVTVKVSGGHHFSSIKISPDVVDPEDVEMLEDLVLTALRDAFSKMAEYHEETMGELGMPDMDSLGGMLGGGGSDD